jgi:hypothetical protein
LRIKHHPFARHKRIAPFAPWDGKSNATARECLEWCAHRKTTRNAVLDTPNGGHQLALHGAHFRHGRLVRALVTKWNSHRRIRNGRDVLFVFIVRMSIWLNQFLVQNRALLRVG